MFLMNIILVGWMELGLQADLPEVQQIPVKNQQEVVYAVDGEQSTETKTEEE